MTQPSQSSQQKENQAANESQQTQGSSLNPNPVFIHYDRGLQEYGDLFSDENESIEENETAETESHRP